MNLPPEQRTFHGGQRIFDTRLGVVVTFCRYTPDHPEYVATVRYRYSDEVGLVPFEMSRFRAVGARGSDHADAQGGPLPQRRGMGWQLQPRDDRVAPGDTVRRLDGGQWVRIYPGDAARGWASWTVHEVLGDHFTVRRPDPEPRPRPRRRRGKAVDAPDGRRFDMEM